MVLDLHLSRRLVSSFLSQGEVLKMQTACPCSLTLRSVACSHGQVITPHFDPSLHLQNGFYAAFPYNG